MTDLVTTIGMIGCGAVVHSMYARTLIGRTDYVVRYVHDLDPMQAASAAALFGAKVVDFDTIISSAEALVVSTPPSTHADIVAHAIAPAKTILCEKPYTTTRANAATLASAARAVGAHLYVGHFRRVFPQVELARDLVGLGLIGDVNEIGASEGGRFTWNAISGYTTREASGGVLWDGGSHTLDMALFAAHLDGVADLGVRVDAVERDKPEPSHDFRAAFSVLAGEREVTTRLHVSRREVLPNFVTLRGTRGAIEFVTEMDDRVRISTPSGSVVLHAGRTHGDMLECFDLQLRRIFRGDCAEVFEADRFIGLVAVLEALAHA